MAARKASSKPSSFDRLAFHISLPPKQLEIFPNARDSDEAPLTVAPHQHSEAWCRTRSAREMIRDELDGRSQTVEPERAVNIPDWNGRGQTGKVLKRLRPMLPRPEFEVEMP